MHFTEKNGRGSVPISVRYRVMVRAKAPYPWSVKVPRSSPVHEGGDGGGVGVTVELLCLR